MFFIAQIQVAQQYSSLTAQNNSATGTRRHRSRVCVWKLDPMSHQQTVTAGLEVLRTFLALWEMLQGGEGNPCKNQVQCQKKSNTSWIAYNSLMQHFVISHETPRRDKRHRCDSTLAQVRFPDASSYNLSFSDDCWIQPQRRSHSFAVYSPDSQ